MSLSRPESKPDFMRGFGVDIPEEEEPEQEEMEMEMEEEDTVAPDLAAEDASEAEGAQADVTVNSADSTEQDGISTVAQSRIHSRHVSRLSAALSLASVGGTMEVEDFISGVNVPLRSPEGELQVEDLDGDVDIEGEQDADQDAVGEWTGSEDFRETTTDDEVSM